MTQGIQAWLVVCLLPALQAGNGGTSTPPVHRDSSADAPRRLDSADANVHTTAEDVLKALRARRPSNRIIAPASAGEGARLEDRKELLPEGSHLVEETGTLQRAGRWWAFHPEGSERNLSVLKLLPNAALEGMVRNVEGADGVLRFRVSGEVTEFHGENFFLPRLAARLRTPSVESAHGNGETDGMTHGKPAGASSAPQPHPVGADAPVDDVLSVLRSRRPSEELVGVEEFDSEPGSDEGFVARSVPVGSSRVTVSMLSPDGSPLVERPGRITKQGEDWLFVFESDHPDHPEPPMRLLPNKSVEVMVSASVSGTTGLVFLVSGEVTVFDGYNYLLPRVARRQIDTGNLRK